MSGIRRILFPCLLVALIGASACRFGPRELRGVEAPDVDRKLSTFAYIEEGELVTFIVDVKATRDRGDERYLPLEVAVANRGLKSLPITRESFVLVDEEGNRFPLASPRELLESYPMLDLDRRYSEIASIAFARFHTFTRYDSQFSPTRSMGVGGSNLVVDRVTLPRSGYIIDWLYFPMPPGGIEGKRFDLFLSSPALEDPVFVKFRVR